MRHEEICTILNLRSPKTLRRHFPRELTSGKVEAITTVKKTAFRLATSGRDPKMTMYWLKTRAGWSRRMNEPEKVIEDFVIEDYVVPTLLEQQARQKPQTTSQEELD